MEAELSDGLLRIRSQRMHMSIGGIDSQKVFDLDPVGVRRKAENQSERTAMMEEIPRVIAQVTGHFCSYFGIPTLEEVMMSEGEVPDYFNLDLKRIPEIWDDLLSIVVPIPGSSNLERVTIVGYPGSTKTSLVDFLLRRCSVCFSVAEDCSRFVTHAHRDSISTTQVDTIDQKDREFLNNRNYLYQTLVEQICRFVLDVNLARLSRKDGGGEIIPINVGGVMMAFISYCVYAGVDKLPQEALDFIRIFSSKSEAVVSIRMSRENILALMDEEGLDKRSAFLDTVSFQCLEGIYEQLCCEGIITHDFEFKGDQEEVDFPGKQIDIFHGHIAQVLGLTSIGSKAVVNFEVIASQLERNPIYYYWREEDMVAMYLAFLPRQILLRADLDVVIKYFRKVLERWYYHPLFNPEAMYYYLDMPELFLREDIENIMNDDWVSQRALAIQEHFFLLIIQGIDEQNAHRLLEMDDLYFRWQIMVYIRDLINILKI